MWNVNMRWIKTSKVYSTSYDWNSRSKVNMPLTLHYQIESWFCIRNQRFYREYTMQLLKVRTTLFYIKCILIHRWNDGKILVDNTADYHVMSDTVTAYHPELCKWQQQQQGTFWQLSADQTACRFWIQDSIPM